MTLYPSPEMRPGVITINIPPSSTGDADRIAWNGWVLIPEPSPRP